jgi:acetyltransferase-like isoleucine patch superfamily enzyme
VNPGLNLLTWCSRAIVRSTSRLWRLEAALKGFSFGGQSLFLGRPIVSRCAGSTVHIGPGFRCYNSQRANLMACPQPSVIRTLAPQANLVIGPNVAISAAVIVAARLIEIGSGTQIGSGAVIVDNDFHTRDAVGQWGDLDVAEARPVRIGARVFVGARAMILKGVTIGDDAVIGAGAVVTKSVPERHLAVGNPAVLKALGKTT